MNFSATIPGILAALITLSLACDAIAATKRAAPKKRPVAAAKKPTPIEVLSGQMYLNRYEPGENLADACRRSSFKNLAIALNINDAVLTAPKGEFETTADYDARASKLSGAMAELPSIVCESLSDNPDLTFTYNADFGRFDGSFVRNHNIWREVKQLGTFRTKTRMGIPMMVKASADFEYDISLDLPSTLKGCLVGSYTSYRFAVPVALERAPAIKAAGRIVYLGPLVAPYTASNESSESATLDNPYEVHTYTLTATLRPDRVVIIDGSGNEIWSCKPGTFPPSQAPLPEGNPGLWASTSDYPSRALREERSGNVGIALIVGIDGLVERCTVTSSSGSADLDDAACANVRRRARFSPATDASGLPTEGEFRTSVHWSLPKD
ncbi:MAG: energy transducer TonB [Novosphingobium sp.]